MPTTVTSTSGAAVPPFRSGGTRRRAFWSGSRQLQDGVNDYQCGIDHLDLDADRIHLVDGTVVDLWVLVVASGSCLVSEATDRLANRFGLDGEGIHLLLLVFV